MDSLQDTWQKKLLGSINPKSLVLYNIKSNLASTWWVNPTNSSSLRITHLGYQIIRSEKIWKLYKFELSAAILPNTLVQLERHFTAPYYIKNLKTLFVVGETEATMIALHANNLQAFLDNFTK